MAHAFDSLDPDLQRDLRNRFPTLSDSEIVSRVLHMTKLKERKQNMKEIERIYRTYFGSQSPTIDDLRNVRFATLENPRRLEDEILSLRPNSKPVLVVDYVQRLLQHLHLVNRNGNLHCLIPLIGAHHEFSFENNKEYRDIRKSHARKDGRARLRLLLGKLKVLAITSMRKLIVALVLPIVTGITVAIVVSKCI